jgi:hypothetical protein
MMPVPPKYDHHAIERLFEAGPLAELAYGLYFTSGFILSVVSAPDLVQVSEWMPLVFKSEEMPALGSRQQVESVTAGLMSIWSLSNLYRTFQNRSYFISVSLETASMDRECEDDHDGQIETDAADRRSDAQYPGGRYCRLHPRQGAGGAW